MGVMKQLPSVGALTPAVSLLKGGNPLELLNPKNIVGDATTIIQKPSTILSNNQSGDSYTAQNKEASRNRAAAQAQSDFKSKYGDADAFRDKVNAGLQIKG